MPIKKTLFFLALLIEFVWADVKSTNGSLKFNLNDDQSIEMHLDQTGLSVGHSHPAANLHVQGNSIFQEGQVWIGTNSGASPLHIEGALGLGIQNINTSTSLNETGTASVILADTSGDNLSLTLPTAANVTGRLYMIKKVSFNNLLRLKSNDNIDGFNSDMILSQASTGFSHIKLISDGSSWHTLDRSDDVSQLIGTDNLIGWWRLDDLSGTIASDSSENNLNGTLQNGLSFSDNTSIGKINRALTFDGSNDYIDMGSSYERPTTEYTICYWIYPNQTNAEIVQDFDWNGGASYGFLSKLESTGRVTFWAGNGSGDITAYSTTEVELNTWQHIVGIYNNGTVQVYKNGVALTMADSTTDASIAYNGTLGLRLSTSGLTLSGKLDDVRLYNTALSSEEIYAIYLQGL